ncbi:MAG: alanine racemase [Candidatus Omnitrophica bacterium]|nr:alanine racemase [Candidatus Omnitrophota bacterium]
MLWIEIRLDHLRNNLKVIRRLLHPRTDILAVVKADAYGHGMKEVAGALAKNGVRFFGVANIDEAVTLRKACRAARILVLGSFHAGQIPDFIRYRITPTLSSAEDADLFARALASGKKKYPVHVKIDTGMGRLGVWHTRAENLLEEISKKKRLNIEGLYTHFSRADHREKKHTRKQLRIFEKIIGRLGRLGIRPRYFHAANSLGITRFKHSHLNLVRPGIILYGLNPSASGKLPPGIKPVLTLKTRISFLKDVEKGRTLSYGATHETARRTRIATLPVGYSHGYRWGLSNKSRVLLRGRACPVVGRVTMDQILVDVGGVPAARRWDEVTLIGQEGNRKILAEDLARWAGTIPYEIVCALHNRVPRFYKD